jgi:hypothetical protein
LLSAPYRQSTSEDGKDEAHEKKSIRTHNRTLLSAVARTEVFKLVAVNPYWHGGYTTPPEDIQKQRED